MFYIVSPKKQITTIVLVSSASAALVIPYFLSHTQLVDPVTGYQNEVPDIWLTDGNPWEVKRNDVRFKVSFGGKVDKKDGKAVWVPSEEVSSSVTCVVK